MLCIVVLSLCHVVLYMYVTLCCAMFGYVGPCICFAMLCHVALCCVFNIKEEDTNGKRYNLRNADFVLPRFKTISYGKHSLRFLGPQLWAKLNKEERNIDTLAAFRKMIRHMTSIVEGCGTECRLCLA